MYGRRTAPRKKATIRLKAEVLNWYRSLGFGYQRRIEEVLSKHVDKKGDRDWKREVI